MSPPMLLMPISARTMPPNEFLRRDILTRRDAPKIGGSVGGFIALVVCLVVIIIASCTAVYFLLRSSPTPDEERVNRRRYDHPSAISSSSFNYSSSSINKQTWSGRLGKIFGLGDSGVKGSARKGGPKIGRGRGQGWIQTGSGDELDSDSGGEGRQHPTSGLKELREVQRQGHPLGYSPALDTPFHPPASGSYQISDSASSVRFGLLNTAPGFSYDEAQSPSPQSTLPNIHTQPSPTSSAAPSPVPIRTASPEPMHGTSNSGMPGHESRNFSTHSGVSMRTFEGGTKFIESL